MRDRGAGDTQRGRQQRRKRQHDENAGASALGAAVAPKQKVVVRPKRAQRVSVPPTPPSAIEQKQARQERVDEQQTRAARRARINSLLSTRSYTGGPGMDLLSKEAKAQKANDAKVAQGGPGIFTGHNLLALGRYLQRQSPAGFTEDLLLHGPRHAIKQELGDVKTGTGINPQHPLDQGPWWLAANAATIFPPFKGLRAGVEGVRALSEGEKLGVAADRAVQSFHAPGPVAKAANTVRGKRAIARINKAMESSPVRADAHAHFEATSPTPEAAQMQKDLYDRHVRGLAVALRTNKEGTQQLLDHLAGAGARPATAADLHPILGDLHAVYQAHPLPNVDMPEKIAGGPLHQKVFELARAGAAYRDWYQRAAWMVQLTAEHLGVPFDKMAQIVAITSQGANPTLNLRDAVVAVKSFQRFGQVKIGAANPGLWKPHEVEAVLKGGEWSGRKRSSFYQNIAHLGTDHVTVDRHVANMLFGTKSPSEKQYQQAEAIFRDIAGQLGWQPSEVQAAMWVPWKALQKAGRTGADFSRYMPDAADAYEKGFANLATGMDWARPVGSKAKPRALKTDEKNFFNLAYKRDAGTDLEGLVSKVKYRGADIEVHSNAEAQSLAEQYMRERGMPYDPPHTYAKVDKERAKRIAEWYDQAVDAPDDPAVRAAYDAMARETLAQYNTITEAGYRFEFYPEGVDPYPGGPRDAMTDLLVNKHMYVFPTDAGFGTEAQAAATHPLLEDSGVVWNGKPITHNDVFRAVHDFFGHFKEGVGFRADGEENAWRAHSAMYSEQAKPAMTAETRGQNSWVNFGPHGEANRTAQQAETVYADQKAVLAPDWVVHDGAGDGPAPSVLDGRFSQSGPTVREMLDSVGRGTRQELPPPAPSGATFAEDSQRLLDEHAAAARDIARLLPEDEWPAWVKNQIRTQAVGRDTPIELPNPPSPLDQAQGPTQRYMDYLAQEKAGHKLQGLSPQEWQDYQAWLDAHPDQKRSLFHGLGSSMNAGIPINPESDKALININLDKPKLSPREELQQHPIREQAHAEIDQQWGDPELAKELKKAYDEQALSGAEKAGMSPAEFLQKRAEAQPAAAAKVMAGMRGDKMFSKRTAQEAGYSQERGRRFGAFAEALQANPTLEGFSQASEHLRGALPKLETNGIRGLTEGEVDSLVAHVAIHPALTEGQKKRVLDAVRAAWLEGKVPTRSEYKLMNEAFGVQFANAAFAPHVLSKYRRLALDALNLPRSLMASFDVSAPFRQGLVAFARHPLMTGANLGPMFKYLASERGYHDYMQVLRDAPDFAQMKEDGLAITDVEDSLLSREEQFQSHLAETLTGVGRLVGMKKGAGSFVRMSGRAYTGFLVKTRVDMYRYLLKQAEKEGHALDAEGRSQLASYINASTGRGDLGSWERSAVKLNALLFSPRLMASRFEFLNPLKYRGLDPFVRKQKIRAALQTAGAISGVLWLASNVTGVKVQVDPLKSDFGKIRAGNTRIDVAGGFVQYIRLLSSMGAAAGHAAGIGKGNAQMPDQIVRFLRGKASPVASIASDVATDTNYAGQQLPPHYWKKELYDSFIPLVIQDVRDTYNQTGSIAAGIGAAAASGTGMGIQSYGAKQTAKAQTYAEKQQSAEQKATKAFGTLPAEVQDAYTTKSLYHDALSTRESELGVSKLTDRQRTQLKLTILETHHPEYAGAVDQLKATIEQGGGDPRVVAAVDRYAEKALGWNIADAYNREATKLEKAR